MVHYIYKMSKLHRYVVYVLIATLAPTTIWAQELQLKAFETLPFDLTARTQQVLDENGKICALIRVELPVKDCKFKGNVIQQSFDVNEYLVYMQENSDQLIVECPGLKGLSVRLTTTEGEKIKSGVTYCLKLSGYKEDNSIDLDPASHSDQSRKRQIEGFRKAAEQGDATAQYELGIRYYNGYDVKKDYKESVRWLHEAAKQGHAKAQNYLGVCYQHGQGTKKDFKEAVRWYHEAAMQGNVYAQNNLGVCYYNGLGVKQDFGEALTWWRSAAEKGNDAAQFSLGRYYETRKDLKEAESWYRKAAEQGNDGAIKALKALKRQSTNPKISWGGVRIW